MTCRQALTRTEGARGRGPVRTDTDHKRGAKFAAARLIGFRGQIMIGAQALPKAVEITAPRWFARELGTADVVAKDRG